MPRSEAALTIGLKSPLPASGLTSTNTATWQRGYWEFRAEKMGRSAHVRASQGLDHCGMDERGILHKIEDDLTESWVERWVEGGVGEIEAYLAKHQAFETYLDDST
jgi:hypothetical protein